MINLCLVKLAGTTYILGCCAYVARPKLAGTPFVLVGSCCRCRQNRSLDIFRYFLTCSNTIASQAEQVAKQLSCCACDDLQSLHSPFFAPPVVSRTLSAISKCFSTSSATLLSIVAAMYVCLHELSASYCRLLHNQTLSNGRLMSFKAKLQVCC